MVIYYSPEIRYTEIVYTKQHAKEDGQFVMGRYA